MITFHLQQLDKVLILGRRIRGHTWSENASKIINYELLIFYQGKAVLTIDGDTVLAKTGDAVLLLPGQVFGAASDPLDSCKYYILHFSLKGSAQKTSADEVRKHISRLMRNAHDMNGNYAFDVPAIDYQNIYLEQIMPLGLVESQLFDLMEKAIHERNVFLISSNAMIQLYLSEMLVIISRILLKQVGASVLLTSKQNMNRVVEDAMLFIHDNYMTNLGINRLASALNISPQYLGRVFKHALNITPGQYLNRFRINRAKELLANTTLQISEISYMVGYDNPYYFSRIFRLLESVSPTQFRKASYETGS